MRHPGQGLEIERLVQLAVDGFDLAMHSARVVRAAIARGHAAHNHWAQRLLKSAGQADFAVEKIAETSA